MRLFQLAVACRIYGGLTDFDSSYRTFLDRTGRSLDFRNPEHMEALLIWLNSWGCRQFVKQHHKLAAKSIVEWSERWEPRLPDDSERLDQLSQDDIQGVKDAYADLTRSAASQRTYKGTIRNITIGPTGAAKILFAARPKTFVPWDEAIRKKLGFDGSASSYCAYLLQVQEQVRQLCDDAAAHGIATEDIPSAVGRPDFPLPKLIDEYHWVTITRGFKPPEADEIANWYNWSRESRRLPLP